MSILFSLSNAVPRCTVLLQRKHVSWRLLAVAQDVHYGDPCRTICHEKMLGPCVVEPLPILCFVVLNGTGWRDGDLVLL